MWLRDQEHAFTFKHLSVCTADSQEDELRSCLPRFLPVRVSRTNIRRESGSKMPHDELDQ